MFVSYSSFSSILLVVISGNDLLVTNDYAIPMQAPHMQNLAILEHSDYSPRNQRWHPVLSGVFEMFTDFGGQGDAYQDSRGCQAGTLEHFEILTLKVPKIHIY